MKMIVSNALNKSQANRFTLFLAGSLFLSIILALAAFIHVAQWEQYDKNAIGRVAEQRVLSQQVAKYAFAAASGEKEAFDKLQKSRDRFDELLSDVKNGVKGNLPTAPEELSVELAAVDTEWAQLRLKADEILRAKKAITLVGTEVEFILSEIMPKLVTYSTIVAKGMTQYAQSRQIYFATRQLMLAQRIQNNVNRVLAGGEGIEKVVEEFGKDTKSFGSVLEGMLRGDEKLKLVKVDDLDIKKAGHKAKLNKALGEVSMSFRTLTDYSEEIIQTAPKVIPALKASVETTGISDNLNAATRLLLAGYDQSPGRITLAGIKIGTGVIIVLGGIAMLLLIILGTHLLLEARRRERYSEEMSQRQQKAILRLMDEMDDLADGDLTVHATVTEDDTGAIADAINNAIDTLRRLVKTINDTSDQVASSAQESRATAEHLTEASEHQSTQITEANLAVQKMAGSIDQISTDALATANSAEQSLLTANKGGGRVRSTIQGMDNIREQIQETSKRIKRLGESTQEIGDIVELIDDIADQTNILALNAAMQAAMAGDAGRGFAVVADEVQRLAERSSNATKQIDALVKAIQADTHEAVASMELSTAGVVEGAKLAEDAGESLQEIESVFKAVVDLTQRISDASREQVVEAGVISETMNVIQEITKQTYEGTNQTARSVGRLADLADDLQKSVSGFRLPA